MVSRQIEWIRINSQLDKHSDRWQLTLCNGLLFCKEVRSGLNLELLFLQQQQQQQIKTDFVISKHDMNRKHSNGIRVNDAGAESGSMDLLPAPGPSTNWTASLLTDSGRDSDLIYRFDGRQAANIPDHVVPQNLTDQFTVATWMKHGPSPGLRAEKETLLCNSDKTGEEEKPNVSSTSHAAILYGHKKKNCGRHDMVVFN